MTGIDGETVNYWAADTLQEAFTNWCKLTGLGGELSSHCGHKAFGSLLAKRKILAKRILLQPYLDIMITAQFIIMSKYLLVVCAS
jgi:hypothetical protein